MQRWLSWSKAHDWKSCVRLITDRGFESHPLRRKSHESKGSWDFLCVDLQSAYQTAFADQTAFANFFCLFDLQSAYQTAFGLYLMFYYKETASGFGLFSGFTRDEYHVIRVDFIVALRRTKGRGRRTLRSPPSPSSGLHLIHPGLSAAAGLM